MAKDYALAIKAVAELSEYPGPDVHVLTNYQGKTTWRRAIRAAAMAGSIRVTFYDGVEINYAKTDYITVKET